MKKFFTFFLCLFSVGIFAQPASLFVTGTFNSWATADPAYKMAFDDVNKVFKIKFTMPAGENHLKLFDGDWGNSSANDKIITLKEAKTVNIYARQAKKFICDTNDTIFWTGNGVGAFTWGYPNLVPLVIDDIKQVATCITTIGDWGQCNIYRLKPKDPQTVIWDAVWCKPDFTGANFVFYETNGAERTIVFDFATYTPTLLPEERFDLAYTLDGKTWLTAPFKNDPTNADLLKLDLTLPADISTSQFAVKYSDDGSTYPANIDGFTVVTNFNTLANVTAGVKNTFKVSRSSANPSWDIQASLTTGVNHITNKALSYSVKDKQIMVIAENALVEVYTITGQKLASKMVNGSFSYTVDHSGIYILRSDRKSYKVSVQ